MNNPLNGCLIFDSIKYISTINSPTKILYNIISLKNILWQHISVGENFYFNITIPK